MRGARNYAAVPHFGQGGSGRMGKQEGKGWASRLRDQNWAIRSGECASKLGASRLGEASMLGK